MSADSRSTYRLVCRSALGRHLGRYVAIDCRWCFGRRSVVSKYCSPLFCRGVAEIEAISLPTGDAKEDSIAYARVLTGQDAAQTFLHFEYISVYSLLEFVHVELRTERPKKDDGH